MKLAARTGNWIFWFLINLILNFEGAIPAVIALILHFVLGVSILWFIAALALWVLYVVIIMAILGWANSSSKKSVIQQENINPYSAKNTDYPFNKNL